MEAHPPPLADAALLLCDWLGVKDRLALLGVCRACRDALAGPQAWASTQLDFDCGRDPPESLLHFLRKRGRQVASLELWQGAQCRAAAAVFPGAKRLRRLLRKFGGLTSLALGPLDTLLLDACRLSLAQTCPGLTRLCWSEVPSRRELLWQHYRRGSVGRASPAMVAGLLALAPTLQHLDLCWAFNAVSWECREALQEGLAGLTRLTCLSLADFGEWDEHLSCSVALLDLPPGLSSLRGLQALALEGRVRWPLNQAFTSVTRLELRCFNWGVGGVLCCLGGLRDLRVAFDCTQHGKDEGARVLREVEEGGGPEEPLPIEAYHAFASRLRRLTHLTWSSPMPEPWRARQIALPELATLRLGCGRWDTFVWGAHSKGLREATLYVCREGPGLPASVRLGDLADVTTLTSLVLVAEKSTEVAVMGMPGAAREPTGLGPRFGLPSGPYLAALQHLCLNGVPGLECVPPVLARAVRLRSLDLSRNPCLELQFSNVGLLCGLPCLQRLTLCKYWAESRRVEALQAECDWQPRSQAALQQLLPRLDAAGVLLWSPIGNCDACGGVKPPSLPDSCQLGPRDFGFE